MATAQLGTVVRHLRNLAADPKRTEQTDGALLRAFLSGNDPAAFEALLQRHGPMVLRVCLRTLGHVHDAEDVLQATFLVLAQQAVSIRKKESLASWLHGVAYRMATHAKRAAARRRGHEARANPTPPRDPALCAAWQELQALLDDEIGSLSETLRAPFVLCCLENKSCAEAARQLDLAEATVWKRLSRARQRLRDRLTRRGVALTTVLAAAAVGANDARAAVPRSVVAPTVKAATRVTAGQPLASIPVSARVLTLVEGVNQAMFLSKCKSAILVLLAVGVVGAGLGLAALRSAGADSPPPAPQAPQAPAAERPKDARDVVKVRGRVLDPDGKPLDGAKVYLGHDKPKEGTYPVRATSGDDGRFEFTFARSELDKIDADAPLPPVLAIAEGRGCDWAKVGSAGEELTLRLVKDEAVSGRILDADGRPVAGARLTVDGMAAHTGSKREGFAFVYTLPWGPYIKDNADAWAGPLPGQPAVLKTDAEGRFRLAGVGRDRVVFLHLEGPGIAMADLGVIAGAPVEHLAAASRPIRGVVRDKDTGKPLAGASVFVNWWNNLDYEEPRWGKAVADKEGRYELLGLAKSPHYHLQGRPAKGQLYFQREVELGDTPGFDARVADIDMVQGLTVRGKVIDKTTGRPVAQALVAYHPLHGNPHASREAQRSEATTGPDGSYALTVHPSVGVIGVICRNPDAYMHAVVTDKELKESFTFPLPDGGNNETFLAIAVSLGGRIPLFQPNYNALVLLEPKESDKELVKDIALERPLERKGHVVGPDGQPITGVTVSGLSPRQQTFTETLKGSDFTVRGINPRAKRLLIFQHNGKNLGYFLKELPDENLGPLTIELQPCGSISGRIVDQDGQPVASGRIYVRTDTPLASPNLTMDKEGRFHVKGLVPGLEYMFVDDKRVFILRSGVVVEPGQHKDLGDIKVSDN
jgi:RNA polymerase sigma factor (sigma-70 family)